MYLNNSALSELTMQKELYKNARPTIFLIFNLSASITFDYFVYDNYFV